MYTYDLAFLSNIALRVVVLNLIYSLFLEQVPGSNLVQIGIDLSEFYLSVEWDILEVPATKNEEYYPDTLEPFSGNLFPDLIVMVESV